MKWAGTTALVTGASSGIGLEFARQIASRGADLVLLSRSEGMLEAVAQEIRSSYGRQVHVVVADLSIPSEGTRVYSELTAAGVAVDHLINNAGVGRAKKVMLDTSQPLLDMVQLNCSTLTVLTAEFLPSMVERGRGGVLQVASVLGFSPCPYQAAYAATKAFVKSLAEAMAIELKGTGVRTTALCPGHVQTGFQKAAGFSAEALSVPGELSAEVTVAIGLKGYERGKTVVVPGLLNRLGVYMGNILPRSWIARISAGMLKKMGRFD